MKSNNNHIPQVYFFGDCKDDKEQEEYLETAKATDLKQYIPCYKKKGYDADYSRINGYQFQRPQDNN